MVDTLPEGYTARAPTADDAQGVAELIAACQVADGDEAPMTADEVLSDWEGLDLAEEALVVVAPDRRMVGSADIRNRRYVRGSV